MNTSFLSLPMGAGPLSRDSGMTDELGNPVYFDAFGQRYTIKTQNPNRESYVRAGLGALDKARKAPLESLTAGAQAIAQGAWDAVATPGRSWSDTVTYGDVANTAGLVSLPAVAGKYDPNRLGIFGGINAKTADKAALARAQDMAAKGVSRDDIWTETGWFAGPDGKWRFEIDDSGARFEIKNIPQGRSDIQRANQYVKDNYPEYAGLQSPTSHPRVVEDPRNINKEAFAWARSNPDAIDPVPLKTALTHDGLFAAYPDMAGINTKSEISTPYQGLYNQTDDSIMVGGGFIGMDQNGTMLHEIQHATQGREGFAAGSNPSEVIPAVAAYEDAMVGLSSLHKKTGFDDAYKKWWKDIKDKTGAGPGGRAAQDFRDKYYSQAPEEAWNEYVRLTTKMDDAENIVGRGPWYGLNENQIYHNTAGEAEARNVAKRRNMTAAERRATPPWNTLDVPEDELILRYGNGPQASIRAYHGSPHDFDRFDLSKVGTGEGAQAYGHGLYFAEAEDVAKGYRNRLSDIDAPMAVWKRADGGEIDPFDVPGGVALLRNNDTDVPFQTLMERAQKEMDRASSVRNPQLRAAQVKKARETLDWLNENEGVGLSSHPDRGRMYEVDINADPADFLDWDAPLSEQPAKVRDVAETTLAGKRPIEWHFNGYSGSYRQEMPGGGSKHIGRVTNTAPGKYTVKIGKDEIGVVSDVDSAKALLDRELTARGKMPEQIFNPKGKDVYAELVGGIDSLVHDSPNRVGGTETLARQGIPGIKYYDQGSRAGKEGTRNYVVFDDSLIEILRKYGLAGLAPLGATLAGSDQAQY